MNGIQWGDLSSIISGLDFEFGGEVMRALETAFSGAVLEDILAVAQTH